MCKTDRANDSEYYIDQFKAYKEWVKNYGEDKALPGLSYSPEKMFFISYAQLWCSKWSEKGIKVQLQGPHSPGEMR
jgi:membrane metallo-endopeptidase-like protein 1